MSANDFRELLQRKPFQQPFRVHISDGSVYEIRHPEMAVARMSVVWLYFPAKDQPVPAAETNVVVSLRHIVRIEFMVTSSGSSN